MPRKGGLQTVANFKPPEQPPEQISLAVNMRGEEVPATYLGIPIGTLDVGRWKSDLDTTILISLEGYSALALQVRESDVCAFAGNLFIDSDVDP